MLTTTTSATDDYTYGCRLSVSPEDKCGEPVVAVERGGDTAVCAEHPAEVMALTTYGFQYRVADPRAFGFDSEQIALAVR